MKHLKMKLIAAAAATLAATCANALPPSAVPALIIYAAGGSAQQRAAAWAQDQILNNADVYSVGTTAAGCTGAQNGSYQIIFGQTRVALGSGAGAIPAGTNVLIYYRFTGGSYPNGVAPHASLPGGDARLTLPYPTALSSAVACAGQSYPLPTYTIPASPTSLFRPDWGLSDEEPGLLNRSLNVPGVYAGNGTFTPGSPVSTAQLGGISSSAIYENVFGVAITRNVATAACPKTNFSKAEMAGVLGGSIQDWSQLQGDGGCAITGGPITLIDRSPGSGSKAAGNLYFLNYPNPGATSPNNVANGVTANGAAGSTSGSNIVFPPNANPSVCTANFSDVNAGSNGVIVSTLNTANAVGCRAVAILGGEFPPALNPTRASAVGAVPVVAAGPAGYQFTSIDGINPGLNVATGGFITYDNEISGAYDFYYTNTYNTHTGLAPQNLTVANTVLSTLRQSNIAAGAGGNALAPSGVLLEPNAVGSLSACVTRSSHGASSLSPLSFLPFQTDFTVPLPGVPTGCSDGV